MEFSKEELHMICRALNSYKPSMKYSNFDQTIKEIEDAENLASRIYKEKLRLE
jgi:hypothetical protein